MEFYSAGLEGEHLDEFLTYLEKKSAEPAKINHQTVIAVGEKSAREYALDGASHSRYLTRQVLAGVRDLISNHEAVTKEAVSDIVRAATPRGGETPPPLLDDLDGPKYGKVKGSFDPVNWMAYTMHIMECFDECAALQQGREQEYIQERYPIREEGIDARLGMAAYDYLATIRAYNGEPQSGMRDVFRRAELKAREKNFETDVKSAYPDLPAHQQKLKVQELLQSTAEHFKLPLPKGFLRA